MPRKEPVSFSEKFLEVDPLALKLLQRLLAFDPKERPTAEQALADPYFKGLSKVEREPSCQKFSKQEFEFERRRVTKDDIRELIFREILEYHPQMLKDYTTGNDRSSFLYPRYSAIGQIRKQFAHIEENDGKSGPVIPPERKHVSLPRSTTVSSSTTAPKLQQCLASFDNRPTVDHGGRDAHATGNIFNAASRPPPRVPKGRGSGPVLPLDEYDPRVMVRSRNTLGLSPHYAFRSNGRSQQKSTEGKLGPGLVNNNLFYKQTNGQQKSTELIAPLDA